MKNVCWLVLLLASVVDAQIAISNSEFIPGLKTGITYIAMNNADGPDSGPYAEIYKKNWTASEYKIIPYAEISSHLAEPEAYFMTISFIKTEVQGQTISYSHTHFFLELWRTTDDYRINRSDKEMRAKDKISIARIELFGSLSAAFDPQQIFSLDYHANGHFRNWGLGFLKNDIQLLMSSLETAKERKLYDPILDKAKLEELKQQTLYVPRYVLINFDPWTGSEMERHVPAKLFEDYKFKYEVIGDVALNTKILESKEPFYYLEYVKSSTDKFINIVNSATGEIAYSVYEKVSYNITPADIKKLYKKMVK